MRTSGPRRALLSAILLSAGAIAHSPQPLFGQDADTLRIAEDQLLRFAKSHAAVTKAREAFHGELARTHDAQGQARLREELDEALSTIMVEYEMTMASFEHLTAVVSANAGERARFEKILAELAAGTAPPG